MDENTENETEAPEGEEPTLNDPHVPVTRQELMEVVAGINQNVMGIVEQLNGVIQQVFDNQAVLAEKIEALEDPAKPRIIIPQGPLA